MSIPVEVHPAHPAHSQLISLDVTLDGRDALEFVQAVRELAGPAGSVSVRRMFAAVAGHPVPVGAPLQLPLPAAPSAPSSDAALRIFPQARIVLRGAHEVELTRLEFDLLLFLAEHPQQVFRRSQLLSLVWQHSYSSTRTIDVHVRRLRAKAGQSIVTTVRGVGYRLDDPGLVQIVPGPAISR